MERKMRCSLRLGIKSLILLVVCLLIFIPSAIAINTSKLTLVWDANTEPNLDGYNIYTGLLPGGPYKLIGTNEANNTEFTWHDLPNNIDHYFVVTAFNDEGLESGYSNEVCGYSDENHDDAITCEDDFYVDNNEDDGSGGRGCFIGIVKRRLGIQNEMQ